MTVTGLGTYRSASRSGQGKNHFSTAGQQETCTKLGTVGTLVSQVRRILWEPG